MALLRRDIYTYPTLFESALYVMSSIATGYVVIVVYFKRMLTESAIFQRAVQ